ncbi:MAG: hypothetical protein NTZ54_02815 [Alphaproteobacteria bacterium]|nr:hypothetical protein [Alphaproteobacteria bacterium]
MCRRGDARGHRAIMHVHRLMDVEDALRMGHFAVDRAQCKNNAAVGDGLAVNVCFMFVQIAAEQRVPQSRLLRHRAVGEMLDVHDADVRPVEATSLQGAQGGVSVCCGVEYCNEGLVGHFQSPVCV